MTFKFLISTATIVGALAMSFACASVEAAEQPTVHEVLACQALVDFLDARLDTPHPKLPEDKVTLVKDHFAAYNAFLQDTHITHGVMKFNAGDEGRSAAMQTLLDTFKAKTKAEMEVEFPGDRMYTEWALSMKKCFDKAPMESDDAKKDIIQWLPQFSMLSSEQ